MRTLLPLAAKIAQRLVAARQTLGVSESSAGGLISASLLSIPGASAFYRGGGIIYAPNAFRGLLGLDREDLGELRSSTEPYARLLAGVIRTRLRTDWGLCETGASGPSRNAYGDAAGHTCVALVGPGVEVSRTLETGQCERADNMRRFAAEALSLLDEHLPA